MKQIKLTFLLTAFLSILGVKAIAYDLAVPNADGVTIYYNYINDGECLEVTRGDGFGYLNDVNIPESVLYMDKIYKVRSIGKFAFQNCKYLKSVSIPNSVTTIGNSAFYGCEKLVSIIIPNSVTSIDSGAFQECSSLISLVFSENLISIGDGAFNKCSGLTSVTIPNSVTSIGSGVFFGCGLTEPVYNSTLFVCIGRQKGAYSIPDGITTICGGAFENCIDLLSIDIPNSVTSIGPYAFDGCIGLTSVNIPNSVTSIGDGAFMHCRGLTSINIPNSVTSISAGAFQGCNGLTSVTIPTNVTEIDNFAFADCMYLNNVTISSGVTSIGMNAFNHGRIGYFSTVVSLIEEPFAIGGKNALQKTFNIKTFTDATLYVPAGTIDKYRSTEGWKDFDHIVEISPDPCTKPTISYENGKLTFSTETEGATCEYTITDADIKSGSGNEVELGVTYNISVYATKAGLSDSEIATATLCWIDSNPKTEGIVNGVAEVKARALLIKNEDGNLIIEGADDGEKVNVYTINGTQSGSAVSKNGKAMVGTNLQKGSIAIVKVGDKSVKVMVR